MTAEATSPSGRDGSDQADPSARGRLRRYSDRFVAWLRSLVGPPLVVATLTFVAYGVFAVEQYNRLVSRSWDLAIFEQAVKAYAHWQEPVSQLKGADYNLLGDHFHPALVVIAPFYRLFPSAVTLLLFQVAMVAVSAFVVTRCAVRVLGVPKGTGIGAAYAVSWGLQSAVAVQFHEVSLALPFLALSLEAMIRRRYDLCILWAVPLIFVKEDLGLTVAMIGIVLVLRGQRLFGWVLAAYGAFAFLFVVYLFLPALNLGHSWEYAAKIDGPDSGGFDLLAVPHDLISPGTKLVTVFMIFGITAFVALRSTIALLVLPTLAWRFLGDSPTYWGRDWHYNAILMPIVFLALVDALPHLATSGRATLRWFSTVAVPVVVVIAVMLLPQYPLEVLGDPRTYQSSSREAAAARVERTIPDGAKVETNIGLMSHFVNRTTVYWPGRSGNPVPDFVLVEGDRHKDAAAYAESLHPGTDFRTTVVAGPFRLAKRVG